MRLKDLKEISKLKLLDGNVQTGCYHQLTDWVGSRDVVEFAISQIKKDPSRRWQLLQQGTMCAVFVDGSQISLR